VEEEAVVEEAAEDDDEPKIKRRKVADEDEDDEEEKPRAEGDDDDDEDDDDDDEDEDPDAPQVAGKPISKSEGKVYYRKMIIKGSDELRLGQDVYLDTDGSEPYVARLEEIFVYSFAPNEVYFNARWYYRCNDCTEYARLAGAPADYVVQYEGSDLTAEPKELFFSLHFDENHADCILRGCSVHLLQTDEEPIPAVWDKLTDSMHEFVAWRAYDNKKVYALSELPSRKLQADATREIERGPQSMIEIAFPARKPRELEPTGPLQIDELLAVWLPRKHLEVWLETPTFKKAAVGTLVRCAQLINGVRTFYAAYVMEVKRNARPYKVGSGPNSRMTDVALRVRTATGDRLVDLTALSNLPVNEAELAKFKVPLEPHIVREKVRKLQRAMEDDADLFEDEELRVRKEQEERMRQKFEEESRAHEAEQAEQERKERERDEVRKRAAANKSSQEAWWLQYQHTGDNKQREIAKLKARLARFRKIASTSEADGERGNAARLAEQAEAKLDQLMGD